MKNLFFEKLKAILILSLMMYMISLVLLFALKIINFSSNDRPLTIVNKGVNDVFKGTYVDKNIQKKLVKDCRYSLKKFDRIYEFESIEWNLGGGESVCESRLFKKKKHYLDYLVSNGEIFINFLPTTFNDVQFLTTNLKTSCDLFYFYHGNNDFRFDKNEVKKLGKEKYTKELESCIKKDINTISKFALKQRKKYEKKYEKCKKMNLIF